MEELDTFEAILSNLVQASHNVFEALDDGDTCMDCASMNLTIELENIDFMLDSFRLFVVDDVLKEIDDNLIVKNVEDRTMTVEQATKKVSQCNQFIEELTKLRMFVLAQDTGLRQYLEESELDDVCVEKEKQEEEDEKHE